MRWRPKNNHHKTQHKQTQRRMRAFACAAVAQIVANAATVVPPADMITDGVSTHLPALSAPHTTQKKLAQLHRTAADWHGRRGGGAPCRHDHRRWFQPDSPPLCVLRAGTCDIARARGRRPLGVAQGGTARAFGQGAGGAEKGIQGLSCKEAAGRKKASIKNGRSGIRCRVCVACVWKHAWCRGDVDAAAASAAKRLSVDGAQGAVGCCSWAGQSQLNACPWVARKAQPHTGSWMARKAQPNAASSRAKFLESSSGLLADQVPPPSLAVATNARVPPPSVHPFTASHTFGLPPSPPEPLLLPLPSHPGCCSPGGRARVRDARRVRARAPGRGASCAAGGDGRRAVGVAALPAALPRAAGAAAGVAWRPVAA
eukprot:364519-Chlamydomonas_euryale.AAC.2